MTTRPKFSKTTAFLVETTSWASALGAAGFTVLGLGFTALGSGAWRDGLTIAASVCMAYGADVGTLSSISYTYYKNDHHELDTQDKLWLAVSIIATVGSNGVAWASLSGLSLSPAVQVAALFTVGIFLALDAYSNYRTRGLYMHDYNADIRAAMDADKETAEHVRELAVMRAETRAQIKAAEQGIDWQARLEAALDERDALAQRLAQRDAHLTEPEETAQPLRVEVPAVKPDSALTPELRDTLDWLRAHPDATRKEAATALGLQSASGVSRRVSKLRELGHAL